MRNPTASAAGGAMGAGSASGGGPNQSASGAAPSNTVREGWPDFAASQAFQLRRLTNEQYVASVQAVLGVPTNALPPIEKVSPVAGFSAIGASSAVVSAAGVGQFENAARFLAQAALAPSGPRAQLVPCTPSGVADANCFTAFVTNFGEKIFRRPLSADEISRYVKLTSDVAAATGDAWQGLEAATSAFLQSPYFLYLAEIGNPDPGDPNRYALTDYELASRLAYFITDSPPDGTLRAAAASHALGNLSGLQAEAVRLLALPSARSTLGSFFTSMLSLEGLDTLSRPVERFPKFTPSLGASMKQETLSVVDDLVFGRDGDYRQLFAQTDTFVNAELASLYGVSPPAGAGFERVTLPAASGRLGLLGNAGVLAARDHNDNTSPTKRGLFALTRLICQNLPLAPPANVQFPPPPVGQLTARMRLEQHATNPTCAGCHRTMDSVGLSLEHFDAVGAYRETDMGMPIDDTGEIGGVRYAGLSGLGALLRDHPALSPCFIRSAYSVSVGHLPTAFEEATFASLVQSFEKSGARVRSLMTAIAGSDGFRFQPVPSVN